MTPEGLVLPHWACASDKRRAHIARVCTLLDEWARELKLTDHEREAWIDAGRFHDALRDVPGMHLDHGPAAADRLEADGETRRDVLEAVRYHTVGMAGWPPTGRALYMADFLEPGRPFARRDRAFLAARVVNDFDGVFRQVVRLRIEWALREGDPVFPETVALWNSVA